MPDFDEFLATLQDEIIDLAESHWEEFTDAAVQDGAAFLQKTQDDLKRWTRLLERGDLSREEVAWLLEGKKDLAEMEALERAGRAAARIDRFRSALIDRMISTTVRVFL